MTQIIYADMDVGMDAIFGRPSAELERHLERKVNSFIERTTGAVSHIAERVREKYHDFTRGSYARQLNSLTAKYQQNFKQEGVYALTNIEDIQHAKYDMRRYVMQHTGIRELYIENRCAGYGEDYTDDSQRYGERHFDYRTAVSGIARKVERDGEERVVLEQFFESELPERQLTIQNQAAIQRTWETISELLEEGVLDMTSKENELLG